ncbi:MAG TPA: hypothetical protein VK927_08690, partial [Adhaeribacter sp.]|nr:hypothetical protein [Adhaeribacter sp.]
TLTGLNADGVPQFTGTTEFEKFTRAACSTGPAGIYEQYSNSPAQTAAIRNFGVPGLLITQIRKAGLGNDANAGTPADFNPYFERLLPAGDDRTYAEVVSAANPTFFTLWIGMADVVNYASSGASCGPVLPNSTIFRNEVTVLLDSLSRNRKQADNRFRSTRKGVICNLPSVRDLPLTRLANTVELEKKYQALYGSQVNIWINKRDRQFSPVDYSVVKVSFDDVVLLKGLNSIGREVTVTVGGVPQQVRHGLSDLSPLTNEEVLDATEINEIESRIANYNSEINRLLTPATSAYRGQVILADMKDLFTNLKNSINYNGVIFNLKPLTGGISSLDLFSFSPRGQALLANKIIQSMNREVAPKDPLFTGFGTRILEVDANNYPLLRTE